MMKKICIIFALTWLTVGTWAQHLTEQEAIERIAPLSFPQWGGVAATRRSPLPSEGSGEVQLTAAKIGAENIYAFNREGGGFVIASADSRTLPVLGYSDSGSIDWERMPENMRAWLMQYDEAIATLGDRMDFKDGNQIIEGSQSRASTRTARAAIEPLIKTRWDQNRSPYYDMCPLYAGHNPEWQGQRCMAGCGPVALAQVLNYWQWPKALPDGLPAYESVELLYDANLSWHVDALPPVTFDWENMLDEYVNRYNWNDVYGTEAQQQAVATLMRYCGQAMESGYSPEGTSISIAQSRYALVNYFGYAAAIWVPDRRQFGIDEWEEMVYTELAAGRPILYFGSAYTRNAHAFVCDGYDGDGLFHINWGWNGSFDGYYSLSVLNPDASTDRYIGSTGLGFTQSHSMIIGLDPSLEKMDPITATPGVHQHRSISYVDSYISAGLGRVDASSDLTVVLKNDGDQDYVGDIVLLPVYYGHINVEDVTNDTPYTRGYEQFVGAYIRAGQEGEVTFTFTPERSGLVWFDLYQEVDNDKNDYLDTFSGVFNTIYSYEPYLVNNSYVTHEGNHYVYHIELCDRPGVAVPDGMPSDDLFLYACIISEDETPINDIYLWDEIWDYLCALPDSAGSGNYKFTFELPFDIEQDGEYIVWSNLEEWPDDTYYIMAANHEETFSVTTTDIGAPFMDNGQRPKDQSIYDLQGRRVNAEAKGILIRKGKKTMIK